MIQLHLKKIMLIGWWVSPLLFVLPQILTNANQQVMAYADSYSPEKSLPPREVGY
jgi:hypothetical protein